MSMMVSFVLSFFPRDVLDEILNLIGSVSEGFSSYSITLKCNSLHYNYFGKMCHYITLQLLYFLNVINYITITLPK